ncbi:unnamed protein product [Paramecium sonneborni]|uniref:Transmembrane protein n=1 Tax=Paramecium sonneborni TaxID=65129 RepID=A0A8S1QKU6_9CILI|nr:unnamed protein product [Paramecium sonneborni]
MLIDYQVNVSYVHLNQIVNIVLNSKNCQKILGRLILELSINFLLVQIMIILLKFLLKVKVRMIMKLFALFVTKDMNYLMETVQRNVLNHAYNANVQMVKINVQNVNQNSKVENQVYLKINVLNVLRFVPYVGQDPFKKFNQLILFLITIDISLIHINVQKVLMIKIIFLINNQEVSLIVNNFKTVQNNISFQLIDIVPKMIFQQLEIRIQIPIKSHNLKLETYFQKFIQFENDEFYSQANSKLIKTIILNIVSIKPQICKIKGYASIKQNFSQNIFFSNINVELQINFNQNTIIEYERTITFLNFIKITIIGGKLQPVENEHLKQLIFSSIFLQMITLDTIIYQQISLENDKSQIIFNNVKELNLINLKIINLTQNNNENFILIRETSFTKIIKLQAFEILNSTISNQKILFFNINQQDIIEIKDLFVIGKFQNTTLIETSTWNNFGNLFVKNILEILFEKSQVDNSTLIIMNNDNYLSNLTLKYSKFGELTQGIINSNELFDEDFQQNSIIFKIYKFQQVQQWEYYYQIQQFSYFKQLNDLDLVGFQLECQSTCLIFIELDFIEIRNLNIYRGFGVKDISIYNARLLRITSSYITQCDEFKFLVFINILIVKSKRQKENIIYNRYDLQIIDIQIKQVQSYNSAIIQYQSSDITTQQQQVTIYLSNFAVESNFLLLTNQKYFTAILFIESIQQTILEISNITFIGNILHEYVKNNLEISSLLLNFNCIQRVITIIDSFFSNNTLYNSTDNIIYIKSEQLKILNCTFYQNSYFNYQVMQPFLLWGFRDSEKLTYQQINNIFKVKSKSGIGQFFIEKLDIQFSNFEQSFGLQGGSQYIEAQKNSIITISYCQFNNVSTTFSNDLGFGGSTYIDGSASDSLQLQINNLIINDIIKKMEDFNTQNQILQQFQFQFINQISKISIQNLDHLFMLLFLLLLLLYKK